MGPVCIQGPCATGGEMHVRAKTCRTVAASFEVRGTNWVNRVVRSTRVPSAEALAWPTSKSPSQCPGTVRSATS